MKRQINSMIQWVEELIRQFLLDINIPIIGQEKEELLLEWEMGKRINLLLQLKNSQQHMLKGCNRV